MRKPSLNVFELREPRTLLALTGFKHIAEGASVESNPGLASIPKNDIAFPFPSRQSKKIGVRPTRIHRSVNKTRNPQAESIDFVEFRKG